MKILRKKISIKYWTNLASSLAVKGKELKIISWHVSVMLKLAANIFLLDVTLLILQECTAVQTAISSFMIVLRSAFLTQSCDNYYI